MAFTPLNDLERLLVAAANDPAARPAFLRALPDSELYIIREGIAPGPRGRVTLAAGESVKLRTVEIEGKPHTPIFTSTERISSVVPSQVTFMAMKGRDLFSLLRGSDLIMNPGADYGKFFTREEVDGILDGTIFGARAHLQLGGKQILLGQPAVYPNHVTDALGRLYAKKRSVQAAYLAHALIPEVDEQPHTLIGLQVDGDFQTIVEESGLLVQQVTKPGEIIDFVEIKPSASDTIGSYMIRSTTPFYRRKKWLGMF